MESLKRLVAWLLARFYKVRVEGFEHYHAAGKRVLIVANHTSFLDAVLLAAFFPDRLTFAINTYVAQRWWMRPLLSVVDVFPMDPANPLATKALIRHLSEDRKAVIFPEGRITVTGALMKVYQGPALVADRTGAMVLPVRIEGAQYTPFSRLRGRVRLRWFPQIRLTVLPARRIEVPDHIRGRARRKRVGQMLSDMMTEMMFATTHYRRTVFEALLDARRVHGGAHVVAEDIQRRSMSYDRLLTHAFVLGGRLARNTQPHERVGVLMPSMVATVVTVLALQLRGRVPAMLNFTAGPQGMVAACETAQVRTVYTSRQFVEQAKLGEAVARLEQGFTVAYLEDLAREISIAAKLRGWLAARYPFLFHRGHGRAAAPDDPAVVLFTSGSEGTPKGVVLSHANLLANRAQLAARIDFSAQDTILNALPLFHSFGLTAGTILPLLSGMKVFFYPSPLHYRIVPEIAYDINASVLFGTNTFLAGYARFAHPYDFYSVRYVFAGAEKLQEDTRRVWSDRFGVRIFEGYGATETSPVLATNTPMENQPGSVGRLLPGIEHHLEPLPGIEDGGRLWVKGPNVMLGYLLHSAPGQLQPPRGEPGEGWYDTGDIVGIDANGFVTILGRAKRFAKIGGEMVSLGAVEELAVSAWPGVRHGVVSVPDAQKGERLVLVTEQRNAKRRSLLETAKRLGVGEIQVPRTVLAVKELPLLGTGKTDYSAVRALVEALEGEGAAEAGG